MSDLKIQKKIAGKIAKVGISKVSIDGSKAKEIKEAITREDIKGLIKKGIITIKKKKGVSRVRAKKIHEQKKKSRRKGFGSRKGTSKARTPQKRAWINKIRPQREFLSMLKDKEKITPKQYRKLYLLTKGGFFRNRNHLKLYVSKMTGENK